MKKYRAFYKIPVWVSVEIEAEDKELAMEIALSDKIQEINVSSFYGNGGSDKIIGVEPNLSIEADNDFIEFDGLQEIDY